MYRKQPLKILVIGGNDAGLAAAGRAKRRDPSAQVTVLEQSPFAGYASCSLPLFLTNMARFEDVKGITAETAARERGFQLLLSCRAECIDLRHHRVIYSEQQTQAEKEIKFDRLILTTGASPLMLFDIPSNVKNVFSMRSMSDAVRLKSFIDQQRPARAAVIGGGYLGLEVSEAFLQGGMQTTLIEKADRLLPDFSAEISRHVHNHLQQRRLKVLTNSSAVGVSHQDNLAKAVILQNGESLPADLIFIAAGAQPNSALAKEAGIPVAPNNAIIVNPYQQTRRMNIYAAGDCCMSRSVVSGAPLWSPYAGIASKQGRIAGDHAAGGHTGFPGILGTSFVRVFGLEFGFTGLMEKQALAHHLEVGTVSIQQESKPRHISGSVMTTVSLLYNRLTRRVLGVQMAGGDGVGHRLNMAAVAITGGLTLQNLAYADLGYTPLVNNLWDPLQVAAQVALKK